MNLHACPTCAAPNSAMVCSEWNSPGPEKSDAPYVTPAPAAGPLHTDVAPQLGFGQQRRLGAERVQHRQLGPGHHSCVVQLRASQWPGARRDIMGTSLRYPIHKSTPSHISHVKLGIFHDNRGIRYLVMRCYEAINHFLTGMHKHELHVPAKFKLNSKTQKTPFGFV